MPAVFRSCLPRVFRKRIWLPLFVCSLLICPFFCPGFFQNGKEAAVYLSTGTVFYSASSCARIGAVFCRIAGLQAREKEWTMLSHLCDLSAKRAWTQLFKPSSFSKDGPLSLNSWRLNQKQLSQIPVCSRDMKQQIQFLEKRWLAKANGFYPFMVDWVLPCFGVSIQVHPDTTSCYARDPGTKCSQTYTDRVDAWKQSLSLSKDFPLILTRPCDIRGYLPSCIGIKKGEEIETILDEAASKIESDSKAILDITPFLSCDANEWEPAWNSFRNSLLERCERRGLNPTQIFCIQRLAEGELGGLRLLSLKRDQEIESVHEFLLKWISHLGFSATQVELDRWTPKSNLSEVREAFAALGSVIQRPSKEEFVSYLGGFERSWKTITPEKNLLLQGSLQVLNGLFNALSQEQWNEAASCPTRSGIIKLSLSNIKETLERLALEKDRISFFDFASQVEQIHLNFTSLLEIFLPYNREDFFPIYRGLLESMPEKLKSLLSCTVHSTAMASSSGVFNAVEKSIGKRPCALYGENAYFENIIAANWVSKAFSDESIEEGDWAQIDLILAQFNPALKRVDEDPVAYKVEQVGQTIRKALDERQGRPLTVAIDATIDFIYSARMQHLIEEFENEILDGNLNLICYRSGLKYDLFGMDNFAGAPFYMIHNKDPKWSAFDALLTDPALQTDRLSLNWFCLAYKNAAPQLDLYRKTVFDNTRAVLNRIPSNLYSENSDYRVVPIHDTADPGFIDIRTFGPCHQMRGSAFVCGNLFVNCLEAGLPIFTRRSIGFYHPNFGMLYGQYCSTVRVTLGLDPSQIDALVDCFNRIDALNSSEKR